MASQFASSVLSGSPSNASISSRGESRSSSIRTECMLVMIRSQKAVVYRRCRLPFFLKLTTFQTGDDIAHDCLRAFSSQGSAIHKGQLQDDAPGIVEIREYVLKPEVRNLYLDVYRNCARILIQSLYMSPLSLGKERHHYFCRSRVHSILICSSMHYTGLQKLAVHHERARGASQAAEPPLARPFHSGHGLMSPQSRSLLRIQRHGPSGRGTITHSARHRANLFG